MGFFYETQACQTRSGQHIFFSARAGPLKLLCCTVVTRTCQKWRFIRSSFFSSCGPHNFRRQPIKNFCLAEDQTKNVEIEKRLFAQYDERKRRFGRKNSNDAKKCGKWSGGAEKKEVCGEERETSLAPSCGRRKKGMGGGWAPNWSSSIFFFSGQKAKKNPNTTEELKTFYLKKERKLATFLNFAETFVYSAPKQTGKKAFFSRLSTGKAVSVLQPPSYEPTQILFLLSFQPPLTFWGTRVATRKRTVAIMGIVIRKKNLFRRRRWRQQRKNVSSKTSPWGFAAQSENPIFSSFSSLPLSSCWPHSLSPGCPRSIPFGFLGFRSPPRFELPLTKGGGERKVKLTRRKKKELWARTQTDASSAYAPQTGGSPGVSGQIEKRRKTPFTSWVHTVTWSKVGLALSPQIEKKEEMRNSHGSSLSMFLGTTNIHIWAGRWGRKRNSAPLVMNRLIKARMRGERKNNKIEEKRC